MDKFPPEIQSKVDHFIERVCSMGKLDNSVFCSDFLAAIQKWEENTHQTMTDVFLLKGNKQQKEIKKMFDFLKQTIKEQIPSKEKYQDVIDAIEIGLESLFSPQPSLFT